jgi:hypothetical protein
MAKGTKEKKLGETKLAQPKWELFAHLYSGQHNMKLFGNGTQCYSIAYGYTEKIEAKRGEIEDLLKTTPAGYTVKVETLNLEIRRMERLCSVEATRLLVNPSIRARCDFLLSSKISHEFSDRELQYTIAQRADLNSKVQAIKEYNRLHKRAADGRLDGEFTFRWEDEKEEEEDKK